MLNQGSDKKVPLTKTSFRGRQRLFLLCLVSLCCKSNVCADRQRFQLRGFGKPASASPEVVLPKGTELALTCTDGWKGARMDCGHLFTSLAPSYGFELGAASGAKGSSNEFSSNLAFLLFKETLRLTKATGDDVEKEIFPTLGAFAVFDGHGARPSAAAAAAAASFVEIAEPLFRNYYKSFVIPALVDEVARYVRGDEHHTGENAFGDSGPLPPAISEDIYSSKLENHMRRKIKRLFNEMHKNVRSTVNHNSGVSFSLVIWDHARVYAASAGDSPIVMVDGHARLLKPLGEVCTIRRRLHNEAVWNDIQTVFGDMKPVRAITPDSVTFKWVKKPEAESSLAQNTVWHRRVAARLQPLKLSVQHSFRSLRPTQPSMPIEVETVLRELEREMAATTAEQAAGRGADSHSQISPFPKRKENSAASSADTVGGAAEERTAPNRPRHGTRKLLTSRSSEKAAQSDGQYATFATKAFKEEVGFTAAQTCGTASMSYTLRGGANSGHSHGPIFRLGRGTLARALAAGAGKDWRDTEIRSMDFVRHYPVIYMVSRTADELEDGIIMTTKGYETALTASLRPDIERNHIRESCDEDGVPVPCFETFEGIFSKLAKGDYDSYAFPPGPLVEAVGVIDEYVAERASVLAFELLERSADSHAAAAALEKNQRHVVHSEYVPKNYVRSDADVSGEDKSDASALRPNLEGGRGIITRPDALKRFYESLRNLEKTCSSIPDDIAFLAFRKTQPAKGVSLSQKLRQLLLEVFETRDERLHDVVELQDSAASEASSRLGRTDSRRRQVMNAEALQPEILSNG